MWMTSKCVSRRLKEGKGHLLRETKKLPDLGPKLPGLGNYSLHRTGAGVNVQLTETG